MVKQTNKPTTTTNESKSWCFDKINKINKTLARSSREEREIKQIKLEMKEKILKPIPQIYKAS